MAKNTFTVVLLALFVVTGTFSSEQTSTAPTVTVTPAVSDTPSAVSPSANAIPEPVKTADPQKPVQLQLFYEALCKDSVDFVHDQLLPTYKKFGKFIGITYIPFSQGKIEVQNNKTVYICPREQVECDADRVHACAIAHVSNQDDLLKFVECALTKGFESKPQVVPIEKCAKDNNITDDIISKITTCFNGTEGYTYLSGYKEKATEAKVVNVPHIVINQVYSDDTQKLAQEDFKKVVCLQIPAATRPEECKDIVSGSSTVLVGVLPIFISVYYIIKMF